MAGISFGVGTLTVGGIAVGVLQNVSIDISTSQAELRGGGSLLPVAVRVTERSITGSAEFAQIDGALLAKLIGGTYATNVLTVTDTSEPVEFELTLSKPSDGSGIAITLHKCISTSLGFSFAYDNFTIPSFDFTAMADETHKVMTVTF